MHDTVPNKESMQIVEAMVTQGRANIAVWDLADRLGDKAGREIARSLCVDLEAAGVTVHVNGFRLLTVLDFIDGGSGPGKT
jgi:hypothetical protein